MKKLIIAALLIFVATLFTVDTATTLASGDKVRGDKAEGPANQLGECPFFG